jgi:CheY-like chemotaxis protein
LKASTDTSRILYADDDSDDRNFLSESLAANGFQAALVYANDGEEAIDYLKTANQQNSLPSLIVLDLNMPRRDGKETLSYLKANPQFAVIPVVILSSSGNKTDRDECVRLGAVSYFIKPDRYDDYAEIIRSFQPYVH